MNYYENWHKLIKFSGDRGLLEKDFEKKVLTDIHACFWELYLVKAFHASYGIDLKKENGGVNRPDFYFESSGQKTWVEAVACGIPLNQDNIVPSQNDDFESCINESNAKWIFPRLTEVLNKKIRKFKKYRDQGVILDTDRFIIAVNGYNALNEHPDNLVGGPLPYIVQVLFGVPETKLSNGRPILMYSPTAQKTNTSSIDIGHFTRREVLIDGEHYPVNNVNGAIYSNVNMRDYLLDDLIFVQNYSAIDITSNFVSRLKSTWALDNSGTDGLQVIRR